MAGGDNITCVRLGVNEGANANCKKVIFVKGTWFPAHFNLAVSDGLRAWTFDGSEKFMEARAEKWDKSVGWVMEKMQHYLSQQRPDSEYSISVGDDKKLSFGIPDKDEKMVLTPKLPLQRAPDAGAITHGLLEFLLAANCEISDVVVKKSRNLDRMTQEVEYCRAQCERFKNEKVQFEEDIVKKFVAVLNTKKATLRELRDQLARRATSSPTAKPRKEEAESEEGTESLDEEDESDIGNEGAHGGEATSHLSCGNRVGTDLTSASEQGSGTNVDHGDDRADMDQTLHKKDVETRGLDNVLTDVTQHSEESKLKSKVGVSLAPKNIGVMAEAGPTLNAAAALLGGSGYTSAPRKRRRM